MTEHTINIRYHMNGTTDHCSLDNQILTDDQIEFITLNLPSSCTSLSFARTHLTDTAFHYLANNLLLRGNSIQSNLKCLYLTDTNMTDDGVRFLCQALIDGCNRKLQYLNISLNPQLTAIGAHEIGRMLAVNQALKSLDLSYTSISSQGVLEVCKALDTKEHTVLAHLDISFTLSSVEKESNEELKDLILKIGKKLNLLNY